MAQCVDRARDSLNFFPTPPWATRALFVHVIGTRHGLAWDPCCGAGDMVRPMREYCRPVYASDVHDYGYPAVQHDFLMPFLPENFAAADLICMNPPFRLAEPFIERGLEIANELVAVLVRTTFIEGMGRYEHLFHKRPPALMAQFAERVPMVKGRLDGDASSATAYCWLVWRPRVVTETRLVWIPPCRATLERPGDYSKGETDGGEPQLTMAGSGS